MERKGKKKMAVAEGLSTSIPDENGMVWSGKYNADGSPRMKKLPKTKTEEQKEEMLLKRKAFTVLQYFGVKEENISIRLNPKRTHKVYWIEHEGEHHIIPIHDSEALDAFVRKIAHKALSNE